MELPRLYSFAWEYGVGALQNDVMTALIQEHERTRTFIGEAAIHFIFERHSVDCAFARFAIRQQAVYGLNGHNGVPSNIETWPRMFLGGVYPEAANVAAMRVRGEAPYQLTVDEACDYHDHVHTEAERKACQERLDALCHLRIDEVLNGLGQ